MKYLPHGHTQLGGGRAGIGTQAACPRRHGLPPCGFPTSAWAGQPAGHMSRVRVRESTGHADRPNMTISSVSGPQVPKRREGESARWTHISAACLLPRPFAFLVPPTSPSLPRIRGHRYTETKAPSSHLPTQIPISDGCMSLCLTTAGQQGQTHSAKHTSEHLQSTSRVPGPGRRGQGYVPSQSRGATHQGSTWAWRCPPSLPTQSVFAAQPLAAQPTRTRTAHTRGRTFTKVTH